MSDLITVGDEGGAISANSTSTSLRSPGSTDRDKDSDPEGSQARAPLCQAVIGSGLPGDGVGNASNLSSELDLVLPKTVLPRRGHL